MSKHIVISVLVAFALLSCLQKKPVSGNSGIFLPSQRLAELTEKKLQEISGLTVSEANPGFLWTQNDSGNPATVYLLDKDLKLRLSCKLKGVKNRDWEDIAIGPGPDETKRYLYVADIGDNNARYAIKYIYRFEEPVLGDQSGEIIISDFDTIAFRLEDGKKDSEAIMVHPKTKDIYIVSKREKPVYLYELKHPFDSGDTLTAVKITSIPLTQIVAADISENGEEVIMKNYDNIYYWNLRGKSLAEGLKERPAILEYTEEPQGEAISFNVEGSGFFTLSERIKGEKTFLYYYGRRGTEKENLN